MVGTSEVNRVIDILSWAQEKNQFYTEEFRCRIRCQVQHYLCIKDISERMPPNERDLKEKDRDKAAS